LGWSVLKRPPFPLPPRSTTSQESARIQILEMVTKRPERTFRVLFQNKIQVFTRAQLLRTYPDEYLAYLNEKLLEKSLKAMGQ
jgi:hypothetical protein